MSAGRVAGALLTVAFLAACTPSPGKEAPTLGPSEFSRLDDAGIAQIHEHRFARFDLRDGTLLPQDVGLPAGAAGKIIGDPSRPEITVELVGPAGTETITTRTLDVVPGARNATITYFRDPVDRDDAPALLRDETTVWGIRQQDADTWLAATADPAVGRGERYRSVIGDGVGRSGLVASVQASIKDDAETHQVLVNLGSYLYTPQALQIIRSTGSVAGIPGPA